MKVTTRFFDDDVKVMVLDRNYQGGKPRIRRKLVLLAEVESNIKQEFIEKYNSYIGFHTRFRMYRGLDKYYLQISGISSDSTKFKPRNKLAIFKEPSELFDIICDKADKTLWWGPLTEDLIDDIVKSEYLTEFEIKRWYDAMIDDE